MGDVNLALVIVTAIVCFLILAINFYHLLNYQHPDNVNQAYFHKTVGLTITAISILILPANVDNCQACRHVFYNDAYNLNLLMETLWLVVYIIDAVLIFPIIRFAMFYYEGIAKHLRSSIPWVINSSIVCSLILGILYDGA